MSDGLHDDTRVTVLGAGPAGVAAAYRLSQRSGIDVTVLERGKQVGGNSASFKLEGIWCDYGSHRFHPVADPDIIRDVKHLLGDDLLLRPRHGRIRLGGRWIHFPLKPADAMLRLPKKFAASLMTDMALKPLRPKPNGNATFASTLRSGLGPTISEQFYFPYVTKLWGLSPDELAVELAERRVSGSSVGKILTKMMRQLPGFRSPTAGRFYYPRQGFGQIVQTMADAAQHQGSAITFGADIKRIEREGNRAVAVWAEREGGPERITSDHIWSTIPISHLVRLIEPAAPQEVLAAASSIRSRGMILIYLFLEQDQFTEFDAHYFPELSIPVSRMSEPKNYSATSEPRGLTVLCAELPCDPGESYWKMSDDELGARFEDWLGGVGLPVRAKVRKALTRRLGHAYPVYDLGYEEKFRIMDEWLGGIDGLLTFGRQGLFAHDNTHHAFAMAYGAADSLRDDGTFDRAEWAKRRKEFESHVVED
jgi:protoporphyrinogen oxidase